VKSASRTDRDNSQGAVAVASKNGTAAIVELKCETDFVAKSKEFLPVLEQLVDAVLADGEGAIDAHKDAVDDLKVTLKENIEVGKVVRRGAVERIEGVCGGQPAERLDRRGSVGSRLGCTAFAHEAARLIFRPPRSLGEQ